MGSPRRYDPPLKLYKGEEPFEVLGVVPEELLGVLGLLGLSPAQRLNDYLQRFDWGGKRLAICKDSDGGLRIIPRASLKRSPKRPLQGPWAA